MSDALTLQQDKLHSELYTHCVGINKHLKHLKLHNFEIT